MSWSLFEVVGVELEYAMVDAETLDVLPLAEELLEAMAGEPTSELVGERISWSNELAAHVLELKLERPEPSLAGLAPLFQEEIARANAALASRGARLLSSAAHPWMDPRRDSRLWRGEGHEIYETFDRIFDCRKHGWLNLQSLHLNLPFDGDDEFDRLHSAIRLLLPLLPGLAASSPFLEGRATGLLDSRLAHYRTHCAAVSSFAGEVVPEPIASRAEYERAIYEPIRRDLPSVDPSRTLRAEWTNARGAIARFDRGAIEIRLIDLQECPAMDLAVAALVVAALRHLVATGDVEAQRAVAGGPLLGLLADATRLADRATVAAADHLAALGLERPVSVGDAWRHLRAEVERADGDALAPFAAELDLLASRGVLARRLLEAAGDAPSRERLRDVYARVADALAGAEPFVP